MIEIVSYRREHQPLFEKFNRAWIEKYFWMEPMDFEILQSPEAHILKPGGAIFMGLFDDIPVGTVALKKISNDTYEMTKMAVDPEFQGRQIGKALAQAAIQEAVGRKAKKVLLYSNTKLEAAIALYRNLGFEEVPVDGPYKRSDIKMALML